MPKAVISNRIYLEAPPEGFSAIMEALTYKLETAGATRGGKRIKHLEIIKNYKVLPRNILSIPQGRLDLVPAGYEIIDKRIKHEMPFPTPKFPLRPDQQIVYDDIEDNCFINALPGWGKTFTALYLARKLGQKTLIVTHTTSLRNQWIEEVTKLYGMDCGIVGSSQYDIDHAIVVGNIQTLTKYGVELSKEFGTVILDEAHHCPATTFSTFVDAMYSRYRIALSGTMIRKDGKHIVFNDYFGSNVITPPQSNTINPTIKVLRTGLQLTPGVPWVKKINNLLYDPDYQEYVSVIARTQLALGHKVLIVASRVEFLSKVKDLLGETCLLVTGQTPIEDRAPEIQRVKDGEIACIAGSRQIFSEGISIDILSCLILAEPIANEALLEQLIGRIMRVYPGKEKLGPVVIDPHFSGRADKSQNNVRLGFYIKKGWEVQTL